MKQQADCKPWSSGNCLIGIPDQLSRKEGSIFTPATKMVDFFKIAKNSAARADLAIYNMTKGILTHYDQVDPGLPEHFNCRSTMKPIVGDDLDKFVMVSTCAVCSRVFNVMKLDKNNCCPGCAHGSWKGDKS